MLGWGIQRFNPPLTCPYIDYALDEYKKITNVEVAKMRTKLSKEADTLGLKGLDKGKYINQACNQFKADRESEAVKEPILKQRESELQTAIPEAIKKCKKVNDLDACSEDIRHILNFCIEIMGVKPKDCKLLVS